MIRQWPLIGRREELELIMRATRPPGAHARGIVLAGSAGVGKTRLAREAVATCGPHNAPRRWIVGTASARSIPLGAFADIASNFGPDPLRRVREVIDGIVGDRPTGEVVIGVDDAHLLDDLSAFTVHQLVTRRLATVILTIRSGDRPPDAITAIWKDQHLQRLELQPLSLEEVTHLIERVLDGPVHTLAARQLWQYTQGNTLYLRHLLDSEISAGRIARPSGMWLWEGRPELSPTLAELIGTRIASAPAPVRAVLDALAVTEPLDVDVLTAVTDADALAQAETMELVRIDATGSPGAVRLSHPMLGEVQRIGSLRLRRLSGRIATELARKGSTDPRDLVSRAMLTVDSDLTPEPELLNAATAAALQLRDLKLAETLAAHAVAAGGGLDAQFAYATTVLWQQRGADAEKILSGLASQVSGPARSQVAILRAMNFSVILGQPTRAEDQLAALPADDAAAQAVADGLRASIDAARGRAATAVARARTVLGAPPPDAVVRMLSVWTLVSGLGALGRMDEVESAAEAGYALADSSPEVSHLRIPLAFLQAHTYRLAGALDRSAAVISRMQRDTLDFPLQGEGHAFLSALQAMCRGDLAETQRLCQETLAYLGNDENGRMVKGFARSWMAAATAMAGEAADARRELANIQWWDQDPDACEWDSERSIAQAWVCAAEGATSQAITTSRTAAAREAELGRPAWEVVLLQTATQFGDRTTAARLAELATVVQGPRAAAAATHAAALAAADGEGLVDASLRYEAFGDRLAAADAAAQAVVAHQEAGRHGSALTAAATARRLQADCRGAQTPALRAATMPQSFTTRQREIISLAAQGLSNKAIADRLTMSIRSVEGHLFRASQRVGANSREQLIAILDGR